MKNSRLCAQISGRERKGRKKIALVPTVVILWFDGTIIASFVTLEIGYVTWRPVAIFLVLGLGTTD